MGCSRRLDNFVYTYIYLYTHKYDIYERNERNPIFKFRIYLLYCIEMDCEKSN